MKHSAILYAKSDLANEIEYLNNSLKSNKNLYADSNAPLWVTDENEKLTLKIKYYEAFLKLIPELK